MSNDIYRPDHTVTVSRKHFASEADWRQAALRGGTFTLVNGMRVGVQPLGVSLELTDFEAGEIAGTWSATFKEAEPGSGAAAMVIAGGKPVPVWSCATCFDQPAPPAECPSCHGSGDPCRPGATVARKA